MRDWAALISMLILRPLNWCPNRFFKCKSTSWHFQPGEGPSSLVGASPCKTSHLAKVRLKLWSCSYQYPRVVTQAITTELVTPHLSTRPASRPARRKNGEKSTWNKILTPRHFFGLYKVDSVNRKKIEQTFKQPLDTNLQYGNQRKGRKYLVSKDGKMLRSCSNNKPLEIVLWMLRHFSAFVSVCSNRQ